MNTQVADHLRQTDRLQIMNLIFASKNRRKSIHYVTGRGVTNWSKLCQQARLSCRPEKNAVFLSSHLA